MVERVEHTVAIGNNLVCLHCEAKQEIQMPIIIPDFTGMIAAFNKEHKDCKPPKKD